MALKKLNRRFLRAEGPDAVRFLQGMWTADIKRAAQVGGVGACGEGLLLSGKGKMVSPGLFFVEGPERVLFSLPASSAEAAARALDQYLVADEVELKLLSESPFSVWRAPEAISLSFTAADLRLPPAAPGARDEIFRSHREEEGLCLPRGLLGPKDFEFWMPADFSPQGRTLSDEEWTALRVRAGLPEWDVDWGPEALPLEFPVSAAIAFHKGCYLGQEVIARATYRGHMNRGFCRFKGTKNLQEGFIFNAAEPEKAVGKITSVSGREGLGLVRLAQVKESLRQEGEPVEVTEVFISEDSSAGS